MIGIEHGLALIRIILVIFEIYGGLNRILEDAGNWEQDIWSAMAIEAVEIGYYDVDTHVALNRIKNHLRPKVFFFK